jgi:hypothetical protein
MAKKILRDVSVLKALFHLLLDTLIAIVFLYTLAIFLYYSIDVLNSYAKSDISVEKIFLDDETGVRAEPFSLQNGWITFMLMSTLIPTFVHFIIALGAFLIEIIPSQKALMHLNLYERKKEPALLDKASHYFTRIFFAEIVLGFGIIGAIISILLYLF